MCKQMKSLINYLGQCNIYFLANILYNKKNNENYVNSTHSLCVCYSLLITIWQRNRVDKFNRH